MENRGLKGGRDRTSNRTQLEIFQSNPPDKKPALKQGGLTKRLAPGNYHRSKCDRYWLICNCDGRPFGGLWFVLEAEFILDQFRGCQSPIEPRIFGKVAERAIQIYGRNQGVAA